ncbi:FtsQ-type POTRA domain-containing protein [Ligilactobacillus sp. WILCCON 0076]|uniref:Cell division protein DivIB n=1 Tax=Ligilactobacillus ubinensis TaxID=2876789 RepID=A0A9X2FJE3_9LACO|nr:cell division protein FtsQ/DivIB [Ligilactobacillus ubinensis]MCP0886495.1 FtsQ-type POTRA domain-containing protein [Ligilactobacillus ubinensis]
MKKNLNKARLSQTGQELTPWEKAQLERNKKRQKEKKSPFKKQNFSRQLPQLKNVHKKRLKKRGLLLLTIFTVITSVSLYLILPVSRVKNIVITGVNKQTQKDILKSSKIMKGDFLIETWFKNSEIKKRIKQENGTVKYAKIAEKNRNVKINILEYSTVGYVYQDKKYYALTKNGAVSKATVANVTGNMPTIYDFKSTKNLKLIAKQLSLISQNIQEAISEIHATPTKADSGKILVYMNDGNEVIATIGTFAKKMAYYPSIVAKMNGTGIVDLEVGAYSYPYSNSTTSN